MEQNSEVLKIKESLLSTDLELSDQMLRQLINYMQLIVSWSKKINLISKNDISNNSLVKKHIIPCLWFSEVIKMEKVKTVLDIGSGAGFPGMVVKILNPNLKIVLIDSIRKKTLFLKEVANEIGISVDIHNQRMEKYIQNNLNKFDATVCRAVGKMNTLWQFSDPILTQGGALYAMKGDNFQNEIEAFSNLDIRYMEIKPANKWIKLSNDINDKIIIKVERKNERK